MKALADNVFIRPDSVEQTRESGIVIPDSAHDRPTTGVVVAAGDAAPVREGDRVLFSRHAGQEVELAEGKLLLMRAHDLAAVVV